MKKNVRKIKKRAQKTAKKNVKKSVKKAEKKSPQKRTVSQKNSIKKTIKKKAIVKKNRPTENLFNLVDEPWVPVAGAGLVSLKRIFEDPSLTALGGNAVQKIAMMKLFLAIAQSPYTPKDEEDWQRLGADGLAKKALAYLKKQKDNFWLYGERPFLQMPAIRKADKQSYGAVVPEVATGNTTVLFSTQKEKLRTDAERALVVVQLMGFGLGGKKTDNSISLSRNYKGKKSTGKPGPSIGSMGYLHTFIQSYTLRETIWLNVFDKKQVSLMRFFENGIGNAPWEEMPSGENCEIAQRLKESLIGRYMPLSRFILCDDEGLHYSEGIAHPTYKEGGIDPSIAVNFSEKNPKALWANPEKRPWRELTAILSVFGSSDKGRFDCINIEKCLSRARNLKVPVGIWSGGLRVSSNAGEQYVSGVNDFVESELFFSDSSILGSVWFANFEHEMSELETISKKFVFGRVSAYFKSLKTDGKEIASKAADLFWQLCERKAQDLVDACADTAKLKDLRRTFAGYAEYVYDRFCPKDTARQMNAWAENKPNFGKYLAE